MEVPIVSTSKKTFAAQVCPGSIISSKQIVTCFAVSRNMTSYTEFIDAQTPVSVHVRQIPHGGQLMLVQTRCQ